MAEHAHPVPLKLSVLTACVGELVEWHRVGTLLNVPHDYLRKLEEEHPRSVSRKVTEVLNYWLEHDPSPSWDKVVEAIRKIPEEKHILNNLPILRVDPHDTSKMISKVFPKIPVSSTPLKVLLLHESDELGATLDIMHSNFTDLVTDIQSALEKESEFKLVYRYVTNFLQDTFQPKHDPENITQLFRCLQSHYCFMNYKILRKIVHQFVKDTMERDLLKYDQDLKKWLGSTTIQEFKAAIENAAKPAVGSDLCLVQLKLEGEWFKVIVKNLQKLLKYIFRDKTSMLTRITIDEGSVIVQMVAPRSEILSLITLASRKHMEMKFIGIIYIQIGCLGFSSQNLKDGEFFFELALAHTLEYLPMHTELIELLLELEVIDIRLSFHFLFRAIHFKNSNALSLLIRHNFDLQCFEYNIAAIHTAALLGYTEAVELLIKAGVSPDHHHPKKKLTPLMIGAYLGHEDVVRLLLKYNADANIISSSGISSRGMNALGIACMLGNAKIVSILLEEKAKTNLKLRQDTTALYLASYNCHHEIVKLLLRFNADPNIPAVNGATPLMVACWFREKIIIELLLQDGAYVDLQGKDSIGQQTALHFSALDNDTEILSLLLDANANVNIQNINGYTPMHFICFNGNEEMVQRFLVAGADVKLCSVQNESPLHTAIYGNNTKIVKTLLNAGADPNLSSDFAAPLHLACVVGNKKIVKLLIEAKAVVDALDSFGLTPLSIAAGEGHTEIVEMLLTAGASTELQNNSRGWTPIFFAAAGGHSEIVGLLLRYKAAIKKDLNGTGLQSVASSMGHPEILQPTAPSKEKDTTINIVPLVNTDDGSSNNISSYYNSCISYLPSKMESAKQYIKNSFEQLEKEMKKIPGIQNLFDIVY